jgi:hypothetical protein
MKEVSIIGWDLARNSFQRHGASAGGGVCAVDFIPPSPGGLL